VAVHALFEGDALWRMLEGGVTKVVTSDTVAHSTNAISLAPLLAKALRQCAISTGSVIERNTVRDVPPSTHSRARL